jgi:hypothetical protein
MHRLLGYQNFLREEDPGALEARLKEASTNTLQELCEQLSVIDDNWIPAPSDEPVAAYLEAAKTFAGGARKQTLLGRLGLDVSYVKKLLLYYPRVDVTLPYFRLDEPIDDDDDDDPVEYLKIALTFELRSLLRLKPLLDAGLVSVIPGSIARKQSDSFAFDKGGWTNQTDADLENPAFKSILDTYDPFEGEDIYGDGRVGWEWSHNAKFHQYRYPADDVNQDLALTALTGSELICTHPAMVRYISEKYRDMSQQLTAGSFWASMFCNTDLVDAADLSDADLTAIHRNEDGFAQWRADLTRAMRQIRSDARAGFVSENEAKATVEDEIRASASGLKAKVKRSSVLSLAGESTLTFGIAAASTFLVNPSPAVTLSTGGISASLTLAYKMLSSRASTGDRTLLKLYSMLGSDRSRQR